MTQAADIRAWLATQGTQVVDGAVVKGCTAAEVAAATGGAVNRVAMALGFMKGRGWVVGDGRKPQRYALVSGPKFQTDEERLAARRLYCKTYKAIRKVTEKPEQHAARLVRSREQWAANRKRKGLRLLADYRAEQAAARAVKPVVLPPEYHGMTRAARVRAWLVAHGPATAPTIREALGLTPRQLKPTLCELVRKGMAVTTGTAGCFTYATGRPVREWHRSIAPATLAARKAHKNDYNNARRRKGDRTQVQIQADAQSRRIEAMTERLAADNARRRALVPDAPAVSQVARPESVEEWMARTGKRADVLTDGEVSPANRLRRIGRTA